MSAWPNTLQRRLLHQIGQSSGESEALLGPLSGKQKTLSYEDLRRALCGLRKSIVPPAGEAQATVGILANRSIEACAIAVACFLVGVPFVPLNPGFPEHRLMRIVTLAGVSKVLHDSRHSELAGKLGAECIDASDIIVNASATDFDDCFTNADNGDRLAYQMFTSGSTGDPKGVPISAGNLSAYVDGITELLEFHPGDRFSQTFDLSFDLAMHDIFVCFASGGTLVTASDMNLLMPGAWIEKQRIDVWFSVPMLATIANRAAFLHTGKHRLRLALFCGEALPMETAQAFDSAYVADTGGVWNLYGPTEATIAISARDVRDIQTAAAVAPVGRPIGTSAIAIRTQAGEIESSFHAVNEGELLLSGPQVFAGYRPSVSSDCFLEHNGTRYYRSGDWVRFDGSEIHYVGRIDQQIKVRGYRVELGEVDAAFRRLFSVEAAAAVAVEHAGETHICLAYQSEDEIPDLAPMALELPSYMIPSAIERMDHLPLNANGKVDRKALAKLTWFREP